MKLRSWLRFRYRSKTNLLIPELVKIEAKRTLLILHLRKIEAKSVYSTNSKDRSRANSVFSTNWKDRSGAKSVYSTNLKDWSGANSAYSRNRQDWSEKNELDRSKTNRGGNFKTFMEPIDSKVLIPPAYALEGLYNNPIPARFLAPLDCSKVPARAGIFKQPMGTRNRVGIGLLYRPARAHICKPFKEPEIDSQSGEPVRELYLLYRLARFHRLAEGSLNVYSGYIG